jgi:glycosyltransferase involved in cell wall biosynthesis
MILVTGTYPPEQCGVADYSYCLLNSEEGKKTDWKLLYTKDLSFKGLKQAIKEIKSFDDKYVNIQYPSRGYGKSLFPHLLSIYLRIFTNKSVSVTIHEYTQLGWKGFLCAYILLLFANKLIFTNEFERNAAIKKLWTVKNKSSIIKIFSNIPKSNNLLKISERKYDIGCFGYIRPLKGIENFIETISKLKKTTEINVSAYILGETWPEFKEYTEKIRRMAEEAGVVIMEGRSDNEVADILADTKIAYLPYPDGLSERRGSYLAFVRNLALIVSTEGPFVTQAQRDYLKVVTEEHAVSTLRSLSKLSPEEQNLEQERVNEFVQKELPNSWDDVVKQYNSYIL